MKLIEKKLFLTLFAVVVGLWSFAQNRHISGTVTDDDNYPVAGVVVRVKGAQVYTTTDINGKYIISARMDSVTLRFTFPGCLDEEIGVPAGQTILDVKLYCNILNTNYYHKTETVIIRRENISKKLLRNE